MSQGDSDAMETDPIQRRDNSDIECMVRIKGLLQHRAPVEVDAKTEYLLIQKLIDEYIMKHCEHNIVYDYIDITPDTSKRIRYCTHCYTDYPHP